MGTDIFGGDVWGDPVHPQLPNNFQGMKRFFWWCCWGGRGTEAPRGSGACHRGEDGRGVKTVCGVQKKMDDFEKSVRAKLLRTIVAVK